MRCGGVYAAPSCHGVHAQTEARRRDRCPPPGRHSTVPGFAKWNPTQAADGFGHVYASCRSDSDPTTKQHGEVVRGSSGTRSRGRLDA